MNNIRDIEEYLGGRMELKETIRFETRLLREPVLRINLYLQKKILEFVQMYHRKKLKEEIQEIHQRLFNDPEKVAFHKSVTRHFND